jgi:hypothetical protein
MTVSALLTFSYLHELFYRSAKFKSKHEQHIKQRTKRKRNKTHLSGFHIDLFKWKDGPAYDQAERFVYLKQFHFDYIGIIIKCI